MKNHTYPCQGIFRIHKRGLVLGISAPPQINCVHRNEGVVIELQVTLFTRQDPFTMKCIDQNTGSLFYSNARTVNSREILSK